MENILFWSLAIFALLALVLANPVKNALFLLIQSCFLVFYFWLSKDMPKEAIIVGGMMFLNSLIVFVGNLYIKKAFKFYTPVRPGFTVIVGIFLFIIISLFLDKLKTEFDSSQLNNIIFFEQDAITISVLLFIIISVVISANSLIATESKD